MNQLRPPPYWYHPWVISLNVAKFDHVITIRTTYYLFVVFMKQVSLYSKYLLSRLCSLNAWRLHAHWNAKKLLNDCQKSKSGYLNFKSCYLNFLIFLIVKTLIVPRNNCWNRSGKIACNLALKSCSQIWVTFKAGCS